MNKNRTDKINAPDNHTNISGEYSECFQSVIESIPLPVFYKDSSGRYLGCNSLFEAFIGKPLSSTSTESEYDVSSLAVPDNYQEIDRILFNNPQPQILDSCIKQSDGSLRNVVLNKVPLYDSAGKISGIIGTITDITEIRSRDCELKKITQEWELTFNSVPDPIFLIDNHHIIIRANKAAADTLGFDDENKMLGQQCFRIIHGTNYPPSFCPHTRVIKDLKKHTEEVYHEGLNKTFLVTASPVNDDEGNFSSSVHIMHDITERIKAEEEKKRIEEQIRQAQKLESIGVLAGGIAHDFNNLLMAILGNIDLTLREVSEDSSSARKLKAAEKACLNASDLCTQMLAYAGKGKFIVGRLNLNDLIMEMGHVLSVSISKRAELIYNLEPDIADTEADATQIRQVILNLLINASESLNEKDGTIILKTGFGVCPAINPGELHFGSKLEEGMCVFFEISDTGCGMNSETLKNIFDPFYTTKFMGRGLGLAAVLGIIRSHNGSINVKSEEGKGSAFRVYLPALQEKTRQLENKKIHAKEWIGKGTILLVDDEDQITDIGTNMLETLGLNVIIAHNGIEAVDIFKNNSDVIDLIILDLTMPRMNGVEAFDEIRRFNKDIRIIISSGYHEQEVTKTFEGRNISGFIQKPYNLMNLRSKLKDILKKNRS